MRPTIGDRWGRGFEAGEDLSFFTGDGRHLAKLVCGRERRPTEGDLIALVLGTTWPDVENAMLVLARRLSPSSSPYSAATPRFDLIGND